MKVTNVTNVLLILVLSTRVLSTRVLSIRVLSIHVLSHFVWRLKNLVPKILDALIVSISLNRLKRVFPKFEAERSHPRGVNGRSKFYKNSAEIFRFRRKYDAIIRARGFQNWQK